MNKMIDMFKDIYEKYKELREQYLKATAEDNWDLAKKIVDEVTELEKPLGDDNADMCRLYYMYNLFFHIHRIDERHVGFYTGRMEGHRDDTGE